ncbi:hypothetical protein SEPCBS119000_006225 [Sporothrix epigloea]|uniref:DUF1868 domain-containing protein n=1 Tax=Sporothrix epigloea TaxID=1892477 RepID=A0ABP0E626_9PEZI
MVEMTATTNAADGTTLAARPPYPTAVPLKFSVDGFAQRYPGNTIICHLPTDSPLIEGILQVQKTLGTHPTYAKSIRFMPPSSFHMTVFDGVRETECEPGMWPEGLEKNPLDETTSVFSVKLRKLGRQLADEGLAPPYRMRFAKFSLPEIGIGLEVRGATDAEEARMRLLRDRLADTLGFRAPNHNAYIFHVTTAYMIRHVDGPDLVELQNTLASLVPLVDQEFELCATEFCTFEDMDTFNRLFYLGE